MSDQSHLVIEFGNAEAKLAPFERSVRTVIDAVVSHTAAEAVFLYEYVVPDRKLCLLKHGGRSQDRLRSARVELPHAVAAWLEQLHEPVFLRKAAQHELVARFPEVFFHGLDAFAVVPVISSGRPQAFLNIGWRQLDASPDLRAVSALAAGLSHILTQANRAMRLQKLIADVVRAEAELADHKIAERAYGALAGSTDRVASAEIVRHHISRVLETPDLASELAARLHKVQAELEARHIISRAKAVLQQKHGLTEQEAYLHLQRTSRRNRKPLRDVAGEFISHERRTA